MNRDQHYTPEVYTDSETDNSGIRKVLLAGSGFLFLLLFLFDRPSDGPHAGAPSTVQEIANTEEAVNYKAFKAYQEYRETAQEPKAPTDVELNQIQEQPKQGSVPRGINH